MKQQAGRRPTRPTASRPRCGGVAAALLLAVAVAWAPQPAVAQAQPQPKGKLAEGKAPSAAKPAARRAAGKPAPAKAPVASRNVAVGAAAVAAAPSAFLSHGCLDRIHGRWLFDELGSAAVALPMPREVRGVSASLAAPSWSDAVQPEATAAASPGEPAALDAESVPATAGCVPFASVRTPSRRIESLALVPDAASPPGLQPPRAVVVSRKEAAGGQPLLRWHDLTELPPLRPELRAEVWVPVASLLAGEAGDVPARWQREVSLLVRQMKRQPDADKATWMRLVLSGEGDAARPAAVELVDDAGAAVDSAIWVDRTDLPGGFVSALGGDYERMLWQAPVDYQRISRGVGSAIVVTRKRVFAQPKTPGGKPRVVVRSFRSRGQHLGIDFVAPTGTPVVAVADGIVEHVGPNGGYGNLVVVDHGGGINTYYAHLSAFGAGVQEGAKVERGQEIGLVGSTGRSTGPHLHFEIRKDGKYLDPADPKQTLPNWSLGSEDHEAVLTRLLALSLSRPQEFEKAARASAVAAAQAAAAE